MKLNVRRLRKKYYKRRTQERHDAFQKADTEYEREREKAKSKGWRTLCSELDKMNHTARLHKVLKLGGKSPKLGTLKKNDGTYTKTPEETLDLLLKTHFPDAEIDEVRIPNIFENLDPNNCEEILASINEESVPAAIKSFKPFKRMK